ncbi:MAG: tetratricopeptide (TPR) repeat protein [Bacteroidia bacterium]|jgi:tetratricopeptide (TPR) repeat protein
MEKALILSGILLYIIVPACAQTSHEDTSAVYPDTYTFKQALIFKENGAYGKVIWFYINLYPENKTKVVELVQALSAEMVDVDMSVFIKTSFAQFAPFDPSSSSMVDGTLRIDRTGLFQKGKWGDELIALLTDPNKPPSTAMEYNLRGLGKFKAGNFTSAIDDFDTAIQLKASAQFYFNRGYAKTELEYYTSAIRDYTKTIESGYRLAEAFYERGFCYDQINNTEGAILDYTSAISINNQYAEAYNNRGYTKYKMKDYKSAIKDYTKAIQYKNTFTNAYVNRGFAKNALGSNKAACKDWRKALSLGFTPAQQHINEYCK